MTFLGYDEQLKNERNLMTLQLPQRQNWRQVNEEKQLKMRKLTIVDLSVVATGMLFDLMYNHIQQ